MRTTTTSTPPATPTRTTMGANPSGMSKFVDFDGEANFDARNKLDFDGEVE